MPPAPRKTPVGTFPGATADEIEQEPNWGNGLGNTHRVGFKTVNGTRIAGLTGDVEHHWKDDDDRKLAEEAMEKHRKLRERMNKGNLVNFRDVSDSQTDFHLKHRQNYPPDWNFVVDTTEDFVKYQQDWPANIKLREKQKEEREKKEAENSSRRGSATTSEDNASSSSSSSSSKDSPDSADSAGSADEDDWRQNRGNHTSSKHHSAYKTSTQSPAQSDAEYKRLREKYTPQEISLLQALQHEKDHIKNLRVCDGKAESPAKAKQSSVGIDKQDTMTPDNWVPRSQNLVRNTGQHPLNAEPDLTALFNAGIVTPNRLHYVRNHGQVPRLFWETHVLDVQHGKLKLSMDDLVASFEPINIAVALACDGNRRGEMNMVRKSKGFTWGAGAMSNAYWKGARLVDVLAAAGVTRDDYNTDEQRWYVNFEGADKPSEGKYATSIDLAYALDPVNDVILAYEMNNSKLPADHGYPVRVIIPGYVGGRCVKWLARVWVSDKENDSHYHIWDNRVLPSFITEKDGEFAKAMFQHPDTACYEQNLNSIIVRPTQNEKLDPQKLLQKSTYRIEGVAYDGGGHEVQRVEVSLDEGQTWLYAIRKYPDQPVRHGHKFWTWCFWHVDVDSLYFARAESIVVRAWNVFKNTQPKDLTWNVMGMMNNCWYRVKATTPDPQSDHPQLVYKHPVDPRVSDGGWMKPSTENQIAAAKQDTGVPDKQFTRLEIEKHDKKNDCWIVINNNVYDVTGVLAWHPGGAATILANAGKLSADVTTSFRAIHDDYAHKKLQECAIGRVTDKAAKFMQEQAAITTSGSDTKSETVLQAKRWTPVELVHRRQLSPDTYEYRFKYDPTQKLGLGTCQHIEFGIHMRDKMLVRQYTPTRPILAHEADGTLDLVVKTYYPDANQPGGAFSNLLLGLQPGQTVQVSGPSGEIVYLGQGQFRIEGVTRTFSRVNLVLGGSGVTPGFQLVHAILEAGDDQTQIRVLDANRSETDILLRAQFDAYADGHRDQFWVTHVLSHPSDSWRGARGHVDDAVVRRACFAPDTDVVSLLCGPPAMVQRAAVPALVGWGFCEDENVFGF